jgi:4,5-DOPA dioxygenase extradiol
MLPSLFVSHGAPNLTLYDSPARRFLTSLAGHLPEPPRAIVVASAHWETRAPTVNCVVRNATIHDFFGFEPELHAAQYSAPGEPDLAGHVAELLEAAGLPCGIDWERGLDHGAWVPLSLAWPEADVPVLQLSLQTGRGPEHHLALGRALAPLCEEGVLVIGSGSFTHDLSEYRAFRAVIDAPEPNWVSGFAEWLGAALARGDQDALLGYRNRAPFAVRNHPTEEHLLPLFVALGAAGEEARARRLHASTTHAVLRMDVYAFENGSGGSGQTYTRDSTAIEKPGL